MGADTLRRPREGARVGPVPATLVAAALSPLLAGAGATEVCSSRDMTLRDVGRFAFVEASSEWFCEIKMF